MSNHFPSASSCNINIRNSEWHFHLRCPRRTGEFVNSSTRPRPFSTSSLRSRNPIAINWQKIIEERWTPGGRSCLFTFPVDTLMFTALLHWIEEYSWINRFVDWPKSSLSKDLTIIAKIYFGEWRQLLQLQLRMKKTNHQKCIHESSMCYAGKMWRLHLPNNLLERITGRLLREGYSGFFSLCSPRLLTRDDWFAFVIMHSGWPRKWIRLSSSILQ